MTAPTPTAATLILAVTLQGTNSQTTAALQHTNSLLVVTSHSSGTGIFRVVARDTATARTTVIASGQKPYLGSIALLPSGPIEFTTSGVGQWEIEVSFPSTTDLPVYAAPYATAGNGNQAVYFLQLWPGEHTISATHSGAGPFSVSLLDVDSRNSSLLISSQGLTQVSTHITTSVEPYGLYALNIQAGSE